MSEERINLDDMKESFIAVAEEYCSRFKGERELDSSHIETHAQWSQEQIEFNDQCAKNLIDAVEDARRKQLKIFDDLIGALKDIFGQASVRETARLAALKAHADNINSGNASTKLIEAQLAPPKRLNGKGNER